MGLWADFKKVRAGSNAEVLRERINRLEEQRRAIQKIQLDLTRRAEILEGTAREGPTATPLCFQTHVSRQAGRATAK